MVAISRTQDDLDSLKEEVKFPSIFKRHKLRHCTISLSIQVSAKLLQSNSLDVELM